MKPLVTIHDARTARAHIRQQAKQALEVSEHWYEHYRLCAGSKLPRANRHAVRCRVLAAIIHDRALLKHQEPT